MPTQILKLAVLMLVLMASADAEERAAKSFLQTTAEFREAREAGLRSPDGWMALVGLHWLDKGRYSLGADSSAAIQLAVGPAHLGEIELAAVSPVAAVLYLDPASKLRLNGVPARHGRHVLRPDTDPLPTLVSFEGGSLALIERGGRFGLRVRSEHSPSLLAFKGLNWFTPDSSWRVKARFEPHPPDQTLAIVNVLGQVEPTPNPGRLHFEHAGIAHTLEALGDPEDELFIIFADLSNGRESYGAGRFLYTGQVSNGEVLLDFNRAINPPCAYTDFSTCPLPPPENRLHARILAGEARYRHSPAEPSS